MPDPLENNLHKPLYHVGDTILNAEAGRGKASRSLGGGESTRFQVFEDKAGEYRWRLRANNNQIVASSAEGYVNKADAFHGIDLVKAVNPATSVEDLTTE